jgi:hypothetical protein
MTLVTCLVFAAYIPVLPTRTLQERSTVEAFQNAEYPFPNLLLWKRRIERRIERGKSRAGMHSPQTGSGCDISASELHNAYTRVAQDVVALTSALPEAYRIFIFVDGVETFPKGRPEPHSTVGVSG